MAGRKAGIDDRKRNPKKIIWCGFEFILVCTLLAKDGQDQRLSDQGGIDPVKGIQDE